MIDERSLLPDTPLLRDGSAPDPTFISAEGQPSFRPGESGFGSVGVRQQIDALRRIDTSEGVDVIGYGLSSMAGWLAAEANTTQMEAIELGMEDSPLGFVTNDGAELIPYADAKAEDLPRLVSPGTLYILESRGFNPEVLKGETLDRGRQKIKRFILGERLQDQLTANTDSWVESAAGFTGQLATDIAFDPVNIATLGSGIALKAAAKSATASLVKQAGKKEGLSATQRFVLSASGRMLRNGTVSGSAVNNQWTRSHAGFLMATDAAVFNTTFDLASQAKEGSITREYLDPEADWWSPSRTGASSLMGFGLGYGVGKFFVQGSLTKQDLRRARLIDTADKPMPKPLPDGEGGTVLVRDQAKLLDGDDLTLDLAQSATATHLEAFPRSVRSQLKKSLDNTPHDELELGRFMAGKPTEREILDFLGHSNDDLAYKLTGDIALAKHKYEAKVASYVSAGKEVPTVVHTNHAVKLAKLDYELQTAKFPIKPKHARARKLAESVVALRNKYLDGVEAGLPQKELKKISTELFSVDEKLEKIVNSITGTYVDGRLVKFREQGQTELVDLIYKLDRPRQTNMSPDDQASILETLLMTGGLQFPAHSPNTTAKFLNNRGFSFVAGFGTRRHDIEQAARDSTVFALVANMLHPLAQTNSTMRPGQDVITSMASLYGRLRRRVELEIHGPAEALYRRAGSDNQRLDRDFTEALQVAAGLKSTDDEAVAALAMGYRRFYDDMKQYGLEMGEFGEGIEDFVHFTLNPQSANKHMDYLSEELFARYKRTYGKKDAGTKLHRGTLIRLGLTGTDGTLSDDITGAAIPPSLRKRSDLEGLALASNNRSVVNLYDEMLDQALRDQAAGALSNKINPMLGKTLTEEAADMADQAPVVRSARTHLDRRIEQEFFLQDNIMALGVVEINPVMNALSYNFGTGTRLARQDAVNRVTGRTDITWEGLVKMAERDLTRTMPQTAAGREAAKTLVESLVDAERDLGGRSLALGEGELSGRVVASLVRNTGSALINPGIGPAMLSVEIPAAIVGLTAKAGGSTAAKSILKVMRDADFSKEQLRSLGKALDFVVREHRHMSSSAFTDETIAFTFGQRFAAPFREFVSVAKGDRAPRTLRGSDNRALNVLTAATQGMADLARLGSGEEFLTNRFRAALGYVHTELPFEYLPKLIELSKKKVPVGDTKAFKRAAREAGFGGKWALAQEFTEHGLSGTNTLTGLQLLQNAGVTELSDGRQVAKALTGMTNRVERQMAQEAYNVVNDYAVRMVDNFIVNPNVWDRPAHSQHPMIQMLNIFFSYPRGFRTNRLRPLADRGLAPVMFWSGFYLTGELMNKQLQAVAFKGARPEDLMQLWEDDPVGQLLRGVGSVPFLGPYQDAVINAMTKSLGRDSDVKLGGSPGLGITSGVINDIINLGRATVTDEKLDIDGLRRLEKMTPVLNWLPMRAAKEGGIELYKQLDE